MEEWISSSTLMLSVPATNEQHSLRLPPGSLQPCGGSWPASGEGRVGLQPRIGLQPRRASIAIHDQLQSDVRKSPKDNIYIALAMAIEATETPDRMCGADDEAGASDAASVQNDSEISSLESALNHLLGRIQQAESRQQQSKADDKTPSVRVAGAKLSLDRACKRHALASALEPLPRWARRRPIDQRRHSAPGSLLHKTCTTHTWEPQCSPVLAPIREGQSPKPDF